MRDFIEYCFDLDSPFWVLMTAFLIVTAVLVAYVMIALAFLFNGEWIVSVIMVFVIPVYAIIKSYERARRNEQ